MENDSTLVSKVVAEVFDSPIWSANLAKLEPCAHLGDTARRAIRSAGAVMLARDLQ